MHVEAPRFFLPHNALEKFPLYYPGPWVYHSVNDNNPVARGFPLEARQYNRNAKVTEFVWGGYFGGRVEAISTVRGLFENVVRISLESMEMWTEESLYSVMVQRYPYILHHVHNVSVEILSRIVYYSPRHIPTAEMRQINFDTTLHTCSSAPLIPETIKILTPAPQSVEELKREKVLVDWMAASAHEELIIDQYLLTFFGVGWVLLKLASCIFMWKIDPKCC